MKRQPKPPTFPFAGTGTIMGAAGNKRSISTKESDPRCLVLTHHGNIVDDELGGRGADFAAEKIRK